MKDLLFHIAFWFLVSLFSVQCALAAVFVFLGFERYREVKKGKGKRLPK